ncbi:MAG: DUF4178 domain-containing protein [Candidatus Melainabacteria bacterium]|jgi:hypothetical protein|nr:MAG: DUF4178 domain-containing protein [Candidatus Melainabacteria bacterium]
MVGNPGEPEKPDEKPVDSPTPPDPVTPPPPSKPLAKSFSCTACGAPVTIKYPGATMSVVCASCHSVIDVTDKNYEILSKYFSKTSLYTPTIPLNSRGKLEGKTWEVIGFMVRSDVASGYYWMEYLLFNPYYGYRFLTQDKNHWVMVKMIKRKPESIVTSLNPKNPARVEFQDRTYKIFNRGMSRVDYVIGEFYWRVVVGSTVAAADYIDPPYMLSNESDDTENIWSLGTHIDTKEVYDAFKLTKPVSDLFMGSGIGAVEPSSNTVDWKQMGPLWVIFLTVLTCAQFFFSSTSKSMIATQFNGNFVPNTKINDVTVPKFTLEKNSSNVLLSLYAPVSNSWFYVSGELVNNNTGASYPFEMTSEYYFGTDSDGAWSEGSATHDLEISSVPGGEYYLNIDAESGDFKNLNQQQYSITVKRDVPSFHNYWWFIFLISLPPIYCWVLMRRDEVSRWSNSDFNPYVSTSD